MTTHAFSNNAIRINERGMTFLPMQIPEYGVKTAITYSSSNNDICGVVGTDKVCLVAGVGLGNTTLKATLTDKNGNVLGSCEAAVIVDRYNPNVNTITANGTVINMNVGEKSTFDVTLSGPDITSTDDRLIRWATSDTDVLAIPSRPIGERNRAHNLSKGTEGSLGGTIAQYFTFITNAAQKTVTVTAGEDTGTGKISGYFGSAAGTALANLNVVVDYNYELMLGKCIATYTKKFEAKDPMTSQSVASVLNVEPRDGTVITIPYTVSPNVMQMDVLFTDDKDQSTAALELISMDMPDGEGHVLVRVRPKKTAMNMKVTMQSKDTVREGVRAITHGQ